MANSRFRHYVIKTSLLEIKPYDTKSNMKLWRETLTNCLFYKGLVASMTVVFSCFAIPEYASSVCLAVAPVPRQIHASMLNLYRRIHTSPVL